MRSYYSPSNNDLLGVDLLVELEHGAVVLHVNLNLCNKRRKNKGRHPVSKVSSHVIDTPIGFCCGRSFQHMTPGYASILIHSIKEP